MPVSRGFWKSKGETMQIEQDSEPPAWGVRRDDRSWPCAGSDRQPRARARRPPGGPKGQSRRVGAGARSS